MLIMYNPDQIMYNLDRIMYNQSGLYVIQSGLCKMERKKQIIHNPEIVWNI
jgi:hypothetical protein